MTVLCTAEMFNHTHTLTNSKYAIDSQYHSDEGDNANVEEIEDYKSYQLYDFRLAVIFLTE